MLQPLSTNNSDSIKAMIAIAGETVFSRYFPDPFFMFVTFIPFVVLVFVLTSLQTEKPRKDRKHYYFR
jgi:short subunit fatty acids transporter